MIGTAHEFASPNGCRRRRALILTAAAVMLVGTACGSTVPHDQRVGDSLGSPEAGLEAGTADGDVGDASNATPDAVGDGAAPMPSTAAGPTGSSGAAPAGAAQAAATAGTRVIPVAPGTHGVTDTTIKIGFLDYDSTASNAINVATGGGEVTEEGALTNKQTYQAVIDYVNSHGGLAGRKITPVFVQQDVAQYATASGRQREQQRACESFTQDHQVFAIHGAGATEELMLDCAARTKTPLLSARIQVYPDQKRVASLSDYWYAVHGLTAERRERGVAQELLAQGFFARGAKVGLMIEDRPGIRTGAAQMKKVLQAAGVNVAAEAVYPDFLASPWDTYVLQFRSAGVTHIVMSATSGASQSTRSMMQAAENQGYRPRWGIASDNRPKDLFISSAPREQLANSQGVGWAGAEDIDVHVDESPANAECRQAVPKGDAEDRHVACDLVFFLRAAFDRMEVISPTAMAKAVESFGTSYVGQYAHGGVSRFGPGRHDGVEVVRAFAFDDRCGQEGAACFKYVSGPHLMKW